MADRTDEEDQEVSGPRRRARARSERERAEAEAGSAAEAEAKTEQEAPAEPEPELESEAEPAAESEPEAAASSEPGKRGASPGSKPRRPRRREAKADGPDAKTAPAPLPGAGTADGDRLREIARLFELGDYGTLRGRAKTLEASAADPAVRDAARELRRRTDVDPVQVVVVLACAAVLVAIVYVWIL